jgi:hypothetical protein
MHRSYQILFTDFSVVYLILNISLHAILSESVTAIQSQPLRHLEVVVAHLTFKIRIADFVL